MPTFLAILGVDASTWALVVAVIALLLSIWTLHAKPQAAPDVAARAFESGQSAAISDLERLGVIATRLSKAWAGAMVVAALLSALSFERAANGDVSVGVKLTALTAVFAALVWLPSVVRIVALAGAEVRTPAGEATTGGLARLFEPLGSDAKRDTLPSVLSALTSPEVLVDPSARHAARELKRELELQLAAVTPQPHGVRETLDQYAREYEAIRATPPSPERTRRMTSLMAQARAVARAAPLASADLRNMIANGQDGDRVVALAIAQDHPDPRLTDLVLDAIANSRSAFEQYQALATAYEFLNLLDEAQRQRLRKTLHAALEDRTRDIGADSSRRIVVEAILDAIG